MEANASVIVTVSPLPKYNITARLVGCDTYEIEADSIEDAVSKIENNEVEPLISVVNDPTTYFHNTPVKKDGTTWWEEKEIAR